MVRASQIAIGHKNDLGIEVNGTKGSLLWRQEFPEEVRILLPDQPERIYLPRRRCAERWIPG